MMETCFGWFTIYYAVRGFRVLNGLQAPEIDFTPAAAAAGKDSFTHDFEIACADIKLIVYERCLHGQTAREETCKDLNRRALPRPSRFL